MTWPRPNLDLLKKQSCGEKFSKFLRLCWSPLPAWKSCKALVWMTEGSNCSESSGKLEIPEIKILATHKSFAASMTAIHFTSASHPRPVRPFTVIRLYKTKLKLHHLWCLGAFCKPRDYTLPSDSESFLQFMKEVMNAVLAGWLFPDGTRNWKQIEGTRTMKFQRRRNYWRWEMRFYRVYQAFFRATQFNSRKVHISSHSRHGPQFSGKRKIKQRPNYFALFAALVPSLSIFNKFPAAKFMIQRDFNSAESSRT